jgi:hypothetical protein
VADSSGVTRYKFGSQNEEIRMTAPAERMKSMRARRHRNGLREVRLVVLDARSAAIRRRVATHVARLNRESERDALEWIEAVSEFDSDAAR